METFRAQVEEKIGKMKRERILLFAWLCSVRALPFIGAVQADCYAAAEARVDGASAYLDAALSQRKPS